MLPRTRCSFDIVLGGMKAYCERAKGHSGPCWCDWPESQARLMWMPEKFSMTDLRKMFNVPNASKG